VLRAGLSSDQFEARRARVFALEVFFFGTAMGLSRYTNDQQDYPNQTRFDSAIASSSNQLGTRPRGCELRTSAPASVTTTCCSNLTDSAPFGGDAKASAHSTMPTQISPS